MNCNWERTQHGEEVMAVLCYLVTAIRGSTTFNTMMAKPRVQSLGHDAPPSPPSPSPRPLRDADGGWRCRSLCASLCSFASVIFMPIPHDQLGSLFYSSKPFAGLLSSLSPPLNFIPHKDQYITPSDEPSSFSLAPLSGRYPPQAPETSPSVADAPPPYVLRIPQAISSVCALSSLCSRKLSWQACRRTIGCGRRAYVSATRGIGGARSAEPVVAMDPLEGPGKK